MGAPPHGRLGQDRRKSGSEPEFTKDGTIGPVPMEQQFIHVTETAHIL